MAWRIHVESTSAQRTHVPKKDPDSATTWVNATQEYNKGPSRNHGLVCVIRLILPVLHQATTSAPRGQVMVETEIDSAVKSILPGCFSIAYRRQQRMCVMGP